MNIICNHIFPPNVKDDKKKYADEVDFKEVEGVQQNIMMVQKMPTRQIESLHPGYLRYVALIRGEEKNFATKWIARRRNEFEKGTGSPWVVECRDKWRSTGDANYKVPEFEFFKNGQWNAKAFIQMNVWLLKKEKEINMDKTYAEYKARMV